MLRQVVFCSLVILSVFYGAEAQCPTIVTRAQWGSRATSRTTLPHRPAPFAVIHHTAGAACTNQATCSTQMRNMQNFHMDGNGWADIGYNFCVGGDGAAYEGRGWTFQGAHAPPFNNQSMGICMIGTFTSALPTVAARNAARLLITCGVSLGHIATNYWLIGHRQGSNPTACPGNALWADIQTWPRFQPNPVPR